MPAKTKRKVSPKIASGRIESALPSKRGSRKDVKKAGKPFSAVLRPKRQLTLPGEICERLGIEPGDALELSLEGSTLIATPKKSVALEALREIQAAFRRSGITEEELLEETDEIRHGDTRERYAAKE